MDVVEVDQPQRARVFEQDGQAAFEEFPAVKAGVAEAAVLRIDEVELP